MLWIRTLLCSALILFPLWGKAQCTVLSADYVCVGELISFRLEVGSQTATAWNWTFGDGNSSTLKEPGNRYSAAGKYTVTGIATIGGQQCTATRVIEVFGLPVAGLRTVSIDSCLNGNRLCLEDLSKPASTAQSIAYRIILWDDGASSSSSNPASSKTECHTFNRKGSFNVLMEVTDNKGCKGKATRPVVIVEDISAAISGSITNRCDSATLCASNASDTGTARLKSWQWYLAGQARSLPAQWCRNVYSSTSLPVMLVVENQFGCKDTARDTLKFEPTKYNPPLRINLKNACYGNHDQFRVETDSIKGARYFWNLRNLRDNSGYNFSYWTGGSFFASMPGRYRVTLQVVVNNCVFSVSDTVRVNGPKAMALPGNANQCQLRDTVYFQDNSDYWGVSRPGLLWNFRDPAAPRCTTKAVSKPDYACNFSQQKLARHWYPDSQRCWSPVLHVVDSATGCFDSAVFEVRIKRTDTLNIRTMIQPPLFCTDRRIDFLRLDPANCQIPIALMKGDSLDPDPWQMYSGAFMYPDTQRKGWQTPGFILQAGDKFKARVDSGKLKFGPGNNVCYDTIWKRDLLHLLRTPNPAFRLELIGKCKPFRVRAYFNQPEFDSLAYMYVDWGDGFITYINTRGRDTIIDSLDHVYLKPGQYQIVSYARNVRSCDRDFRTQTAVGVYANIQQPGFACPGNTVQFQASVGYYSGANYQVSKGKSDLRWEMGDSTVYEDSIFSVHHAYKRGGQYQVRLIVTDSVGCKDTATALFRTSLVRAGMRLPNRRLLCSEIVQLFDSSFLFFGAPGERIRSYYWEFGDGGNFSTLKDPFKFYGQSGTYTITHTVETTSGCKDTVRRSLRLDGPEPLFDIDGDSIGCVPFTVRLRNRSRNATRYIWYSGDRQGNILYTSADTAVRFTYTEPGVYYLRLYAGDSTFNPSTGQYYYCASVFPDSFRHPGVYRRVIVYPYIPVAIVAPDTVCVNEPFTAAARYDSLYNRFAWQTGDGRSEAGSADTLQHRYADTGTYRMALYPTYPVSILRPGCFDSAWKDVVAIGVKAGFIIDPQSDTPVYRFFNRSSWRAVRWLWDFGHPASGKANQSEERHPTHDYGIDTGWYKVCLTAWNAQGCSDSVCGMLYNNFFQYIYIPNVFTPGRDGFNDSFYIDILGESEYELHIYNRWGQAVFHSPSDGRSWNGRLRNRGEELPEGTYYYLFHYRWERRDTGRKKVEGVVNLIRE